MLSRLGYYHSFSSHLEYWHSHVICWSNSFHVSHSPYHYLEFFSPTYYLICCLSHHISGLNCLLWFTERLLWTSTEQKTYNRQKRNRLAVELIFIFSSMMYVYVCNIYIVCVLFCILFIIIIMFLSLMDLPWFLGLGGVSMWGLKWFLAYFRWRKSFINRRQS